MAGSCGSVDTTGGSFYRICGKSPALSYDNVTAELIEFAIN